MIYHISLFFAFMSGIFALEYSGKASLGLSIYLGLAAILWSLRKDSR